MRFFLTCRPGHALCEVGRGVVMDNSLVPVEEGGGPANPKKLKCGLREKRRYQGRLFGTFRSSGDSLFPVCLYVLFL